MACDICGKTGVHLEDLNAEYRTDDIQNICGDCSKSVNDHLWKLRVMSQKMNCVWLKKFMRTIKGQSK